MQCFVYCQLKLLCMFYGVYIFSIKSYTKFQQRESNKQAKQKQHEMVTNLQPSTEVSSIAFQNPIVTPLSVLTLLLYFIAAEVITCNAFFKIFY